MSQKNGNEAAKGSRQKKKRKKKQKKGGDKKGVVKKPSNQSVQSFDLHRKNRSFVFFCFFCVFLPVLFPLDGGRRLGADVVRDPVDPSDLVDDPVGRAGNGSWVKSRKDTK